MTAIKPGKLITAEELAELPEDDCAFELDEGRLLCVSFASAVAGVVASNIGGELARFTRSQGLGLCGAAAGMLLATNPDSVRVPDMWSVSGERIPTSGIPTGFWPGAPDLTLDVLSPWDGPAQTSRKVSQYLEHGVRLVWVVDPVGRWADIFRPGMPVVRIDESGFLDGEDVVPGFRLLLADALELPTGQG